MEFKGFIAFFVVLIGISLTSGEDPEKEACKKMAVQYFKRIHKIAIDCHADVKENATSIEDTYEKIGCTVKCFLKADKMLDDNDMVSEDLMKATYKNRVHPKYEDKLLAKFMDCKTNFGDKLDKNDDKCVSYKKYGLCMQDALSHVCYE